MTARTPTRQTRGILAVFVVTSVTLGVIAATPSCGGPPNKTCNAMDVIFPATIGSYPGSQACASCLQSKNAPKSCCDALGSCAEDPDCKREFLATHTCITGSTNPSEATRCRDSLTNEKGKTLYGCMRATCGPECAVPSCDLDPAFVFFGNPACDRCVGGSCCEKINACYKSRECGLIVKCIVERCPRTLAPALTALGLASVEARAVATTAVCAGQALPAGNEQLACVQRCLQDLSPSGVNATVDDTNARCLAFGVFTCGAEARCGPVCADGGVPNDGVYGEDTQPDASAGDAKAP